MAKFKGKYVSMTHANIKEITCLVHIYSDLCALVPATRPTTMQWGEILSDAFNKVLENAA